jgi:hypothetical protein
MHCRRQRAPCVKSCAVRQCRRYQPHEAGLECLITSEQRWKALFKLKYPDLEVPDNALVESCQTQGDIAAASHPQQDLIGLGGNASSEPIDFFSTTQTREPEADTRQPDNAISPVVHPGETVSSAQRTFDEVLNELRALPAQVQLLEQRIMAVPSERERNLEMVIGLLWEFCQRLEPRGSREGSHLRRLISQYAPDVLSPDSADQENPPQMAGPLDATLMDAPDFTWADFEEIINDTDCAGPSNAPRADSAYQSGKS